MGWRLSLLGINGIPKDLETIQCLYHSYMHMCMQVDVPYTCRYTVMLCLDLPVTHNVRSRLSTSVCMYYYGRLVASMNQVIVCVHVPENSVSFSSATNPKT